MNQPDPENQTESFDTLQVLLYETSPFGNVDAIVQTDGKTVYFYLFPRGSEEYFAPKACWVRNLELGPYVINQDDFLAGRQVALPRTHARSIQLAPRPSPDDLRVIWFEEGNGAALFERVAVPTNNKLRQAAEDGLLPPGKAFPDVPSDHLLAVIPPWSGRDGFHGYAADCAMDSPICWPLPKNPRLRERIAKADEFWKSFSHQPDPFVQLREELLKAYPEFLMLWKPTQDSSSSPIVSQQYYDIGGDRFPPRGLIEYRMENRIVELTVGMSLCPQPNVELSTPDSTAFRRIELGIELPANSQESIVGKARTELSRLAGYPWQTFRWLGEGHTCQFPNVFAENDVAELIVNPSPATVGDEGRIKSQPHESNMSRLSWPYAKGDSITVLWLVPKR
jgi:hypothetical protein